MKTPMRKSMLTIIALLAASVMMPAIQTYAAAARGRGVNTVRNTTRQNSRPQNQGGEGPLANINEDWYLEFTPSYIRAGGSNLDTFFGATVAIGYKLSLEDRIQFEIGLYGSNTYTDNNFSYSWSGNYTGTLNDIPVVAPNNAFTIPFQGSRTAKAKMVPLLISYTYSIRLDSAERWEFRLSPAAGFLAMFDTWSITDKTGGSFTVSDGTIITGGNLPPGATISPDGSTITARNSQSGSDSKFAYTLGGGLGLTYYFADRWYADIGYRFLWTAKVPNKLPANTPWNGVRAWNGLNTHVYTLTLGWKF